MTFQQLKQVELESKYRAASRRLIVLEYDGVLAPRQKLSLTRPERNMRSVVSALSADLANTVMIVSSRNCEHLDLHWSNSNLVLVAEHGAMHKPPGGRWESYFGINTEWMNPVSQALRQLPAEYPGTIVQEKRFTISWNFQAMADRISDSEIRNIENAITSLPQHGEFVTYRDHDSLELTPYGVDPATFLVRWLGARRFDFVMALGSKSTDQSIAVILTKDAFTIRVEPDGVTRSRFALVSQEQVYPLLKSLASQSHPGMIWNVVRWLH